MFSAHVHGSGDHAYPDQDPAELRAQAVREQFERIRHAEIGLDNAWNSYHRAGLNPRTHGQPDYKPVGDAMAYMARVRQEAEHAIIQALEEAQVPVVHETPHGD